MATSNDFGMPVAISPPISIGSEWSSKTDAPKLAREMAAGPRLAPPSAAIAFTSANHARVYITAYGLQNDFAVSVRNFRRARNAVLQMCCSRSRNDWIGIVQGDCKFEVVVKFDDQGNLATVKAMLVHSHELDIKARPSQFLPTNPFKDGLPAGSGGALRSHQSRDYVIPDTSDESSEESEHESSNERKNAAHDSEWVDARAMSPAFGTDRKTREGAAVPRTVLVNAQAQALVDSGALLTPILDCRGSDSIGLQVKITAFALSTGFTLRHHHLKPHLFDLRCARNATDCKYKVYASAANNGWWKVDRVFGVHNHVPVMPVRASVAVVRGELGTSGTGGGGGGGKKRARGDGVVSTSESTHRSRDAPPFAQTRLPVPFKRVASSANAVASGSGSRGTPATQYHSGSVARPSTSSHTTVSPQNPTTTSPVTLPWPRELARLVGSVNPLLLRKSHTFAKLLIPIGIVNRHEFSKMIWSFGATDQHDKRMNWFKIHLRKGNELVEMDFMQFRIGAARICKGIPVMAS